MKKSDLKKLVKEVISEIRPPMNPNYAAGGKKVEIKKYFEAIKKKLNSELVGKKVDVRGGISSVPEDVDMWVGVVKNVDIGSFGYEGADVSIQFKDGQTVEGFHYSLQIHIVK